MADDTSKIRPIRSLPRDGRREVREAEIRFFRGEIGGYYVNRTEAGSVFVHVFPIVRTEKAA
jgi:hypothetical protein